MIEVGVIEVRAGLGHLMNYRVVERLLSALASTGRYPGRLCAATVMNCVSQVTRIDTERRSQPSGAGGAAADIGSAAKAAGSAAGSGCGSGSFFACDNTTRSVTTTNQLTKKLM